MGLARGDRLALPRSRHRRRRPRPGGVDGAAEGGPQASTSPWAWSSCPTPSVTMKGEVKRQFRDFGWMVRPPRADPEAAGRRQPRAGRAHPHARSFPPGRARSPPHLDVPVEDVVEALSADGCYAPTSLDTPVGDDGTGVLGELLPGDDSAMSDAEARMMLAPPSARLPERERRDPLPALLQAADPGPDRRRDRGHPDAGVPDPVAGARRAARGSWSEPAVSTPVGLPRVRLVPTARVRRGETTTEGNPMPSWIIVVIIAVAVIVCWLAALVAAAQEAAERKRRRPGELREQAAAHATGGRSKREAHARETEARPPRRAEAERSAPRPTVSRREAHDRQPRAAGRPRRARGAAASRRRARPRRGHPGRRLLPVPYGNPRRRPTRTAPTPTPATPTLSTPTLPAHRRPAPGDQYTDSSTPRGRTATAGRMSPGPTSTNDERETHDAHTLRRQRRATDPDV